MSPKNQPSEFQLNVKQFALDIIKTKEKLYCQLHIAKNKIITKFTLKIVFVLQILTNIKHWNFEGYLHFTSLIGK